MKRLKVLMSAYACEPNKGSEPEVGWNIPREMAKHHDIWVITRENNRPTIERELARHPVPNLHLVYYDMPPWIRWWKRGGRGLQIYYYLWQLAIYFLARRLHRKIEFDLVHHVTFVRYWTPSLLALLPAPFLWGPVGGGESTPEPFLDSFSPKGKRYERLRSLARWLGEHDPLVRLTAQRSMLALGATKDTAHRLQALGAKKVEVVSQLGFSTRDLRALDDHSQPASRPFRIISIGKLLHWKGFHLGLRAFAHANVPKAEYWIVGDGPERARLETLVETLDIAQQVTFWGKLSRQDTLAKLSQCHVLMHPSLHDSGGFVCLEAMAAARPVICLDLGGPALQVTPETGIKVAAHTPEQAIDDLRRSLLQLAHDEPRRQSMASQAQARVQQNYDWRKKANYFSRVYTSLTHCPQDVTQT